MKNEARAALNAIRLQIDGMAEELNMLVDEDDIRWERISDEVVLAVMHSTPDEMIQTLTDLADRIEKIDNELMTLESIEDNDIMEYAYKSSADLYLPLERVRTLTEVEGPFRSEDC